MSHADTMVLEIHRELVPLYPIPPCLEISDEPAGDFGIAHFYGVRPDGCGILTGWGIVSFDVGYLPTRHTVVHELGHGLHAYVQRFISPEVAHAFWAACGFTTSIVDAVAISNRFADAGYAYTAWQYAPNEVLADVFAFVVLGDFLMVETYGVDPATLRERARAFFQAYKEGEMARLDPADMAELKAHIDARIARAEQNLTVEIVGALKSGFDVTLPTLLNRHAAGDTDVSTAANEGR